MRPLRRKQNCQVTTDPETGQERMLSCSREETVLSDDRSIDTVNVQRKYFLDCGCDAEAAGRCFECGKISCSSCHGRCAVCRKPICLEHSRFVKGANGETLRICRTCADKASRKQTRSAIWGFVLSIFVQRKGEHDG